MKAQPLVLNPERYFSSNPKERELGLHLYHQVKDMPLLCPHGHVDPRLFAENKPFPDPAELLVIPDHYLFRMLYSHGIAMESLGVPLADGGAMETDRRKIWQLVADHMHLFNGTPTGMWLKHELSEVLGVRQRLCHETAMEIYDQIVATLAKPENLPRAMFERFNIEALSTTDSPIDTLEHHQKIRASGWPGRVIPAFRPDTVTDLLFKGWRQNIDKLSQLSGLDCTNYKSFISALEKRRAFFKEMGATSTDQGVLTAFTVELSQAQAADLFDRAIQGKATVDDARLFTGHMLMEMARMSVEDGLTMQIHPGVLRNHNPSVYQTFGPDKGCDIPIAVDFTHDLKPLLNKFGNQRDLTIVVFTIDETTFSRELAPLAGHYPAMKLGPAWWFLDSREAMLRFRRLTTETAGFYNTVGFIDDTRAFPSIPARHDLARRIDCRYLAELVAEHVIELDEAEELARQAAYHLAKMNFKL